MLDFQQKRKFRSIAFHKATLIVLGILVLVFAHSTWKVFQKKRLSEQAKNISMREVEELRQRDADLKSKTERLNTDSGIEEEIRSKFSVVKEGENMVVIVEDQDSGVSTTSSSLGFWQKLLDFLIR